MESDANNHFLGCTQFRATAATRRHDMGVRALEAVLRAGGASVHVEVPTGVGNRRFDLVIFGGGSALAVDVTVPHPLAPSYMMDGDALIQGRVGANAEHNKRVGYAAEAALAGLEFFPLVVESLGGWSKSGHELMRRLPSLLQSAQRLCGFSASEMRRRAVEAVSMAIQKGNVGVLLEGHARSLGSAVRRQPR